MTEEIKKQAAGLFSRTIHNVLYVNPRGSFFASENLCINSLKSGEKYEVITRADIQNPVPESDPESQKEPESESDPESKTEPDPASKTKSKTSKKSK